MQATSLGYQTELISLAFRGVVIDRGDYLVVQSPHNPGYYRGNLLLFPSAPGPGDAARWQKLFDREIGGLPGIKHVAYGWDAADQGDCSELAAAGFTIDSDVVLATRQPQPARVIDGLILRKLQGDADWERIAELNYASEELTRTSSAFALFRKRAFAHKRAMVEAGLGHWMGAFMDRTLVAQMGIFRGGELARFANVETHPAYRRRGICGALVVETTRVALEELGARVAVIVANPETVAERVYRAAGFSEDSRSHAATRAPRTD